MIQYRKCNTSHESKKKKKKNEKRTANFEKMTQNLDYVDL